MKREPAKIKSFFLIHILKIKKAAINGRPILWEHTGSNRGPSACKADALNQLSYAPLFWEGKDRVSTIPTKFFWIFSYHFQHIVWNFIFKILPIVKKMLI